MKRLIALTTALGLGLFLTTGLVGCGEENASEVTVKQDGPGGTTQETIRTEVEQTGDNPPPPTGAVGEPGPINP